MAADGLGSVRASFNLLEEGRPAFGVLRALIDETIAKRAVAVVDVEASDDGDPGWWQPERLLGRSARLALWRDGQEVAPREFCGVVRGVERDAGARTSLRLRVEPAFACLDEERLTRPFVGLSAIEILREILAAHLTPLDGREVELRLSQGPRGPVDADHCDHGFPRRPLCMQYGETTYDFCRRLMAEERLAHFFEHGARVERLVVVDGGGPFDRRPGTVIVADRRRMEATAEGVFNLSRSLGSGSPSLAGDGDVVGFAPGRVIALEASSLSAPAWLHDPGSEELGMLLTQVRHTFDRRVLDDEHREGATYGCAFQGIPMSEGFGPAPIEKPRALEDWGIVESSHRQDPIEVDPLGGVRVAFLHDRRRGLIASQRSPPVPVGQAWAGDGYGTQILPRAGMLARIEYLGGDPDRPIVAACFPTSANRLPAAPPAEKTRLTLRTRDLRGEDPEPDRHRNELALDDAARAEEIWIRAGRDHIRRVLHDEDARIDHDESRRVGGRQRLHVSGNRTKLVDGGESARVGGSRRTEVGGDDRRVGVSDDAAGGHDALSIDGNAAASISGNRATSVGGDEAAVFQGGRATDVGDDDTLLVGRIRNVVADQQLVARQGCSSVALRQGSAQVQAERQLALTNPRGELVLDAGGNAGLSARTIELRCGSSSIWIGGREAAIRAPTVVVRSPGGQITLDQQGAVLDAQEITSSAVMLNAIRGACVIFSDSPGNFAAAPADTTIMQSQDKTRNGGGA